MSGAVSAGRFVLVDRHLSVRLPHDQAHVVENVTVEEAAALRDWSMGLCSEPVPGIATFKRTLFAAAVLRADGNSVEELRAYFGGERMWRVGKPDGRYTVVSAELLRDSAGRVLESMTKRLRGDHG